MTSWVSVSQTLGFITIYTLLITVTIFCLFACSVWLKSLVISVQKKFPRYAFATVIAMYWIQGEPGARVNRWRDDQGRLWKFEIVEDSESGCGGGDDL